MYMKKALFKIRNSSLLYHTHMKIYVYVYICLKSINIHGAQGRCKSTSDLLNQNFQLPDAGSRNQTWMPNSSSAETTLWLPENEEAPTSIPSAFHHLQVMEVLATCSVKD